MNDWLSFNNGEGADDDPHLYIPLEFLLPDGRVAVGKRGFIGHAYWHGTPNRTQFNPQPTHWREIA